MAGEKTKQGAVLMTEITPSDGATWQVSKNATWSGLEGEVVILDMENGLYFGLNKVGSTIWQLIEQRKKLSEILSAILSTYAVDEATASMEVANLIGELAAKGLIERAPLHA